MVVNASITGTKPVKRSWSSVQDSYTDWESCSVMGSSLRPSINLPFAHYAMIYLDNAGKLRVSESASIQRQKRSVITPEVRERFLESIGYQRPMIRRAPAVPYGYNHNPAHDLSYLRQSKRRKASAHDPALEMSFSEHFPEPAVPQIPSSANRMAALKIGDTEKVTLHYFTALKDLQQINCRLIAKAFIKFIEPRKQVKHPYNGGRPRAGAPPGEKGDPEKTKPEWWPSGVQHKEPDHLKKEQRLRLLVHILRMPEKFNISSDKLNEIAQDCKRQLRPEECIDEKMEILNEIFRVRRLEERFERGEVDADTVVYVRNRDAPAKDAKDNESVISDADLRPELEDFEDVEENPLTSSSEHLSASFTSVDPLALTPNRSFHMSNDRSQTFSLNEALSFEEPSKEDRPYEFEDYSSHPTFRTPGMISPDEHSGHFDYLSHASFPASSGCEQDSSLTMPMPHTGHLDTWSSPFRPNIYNTVDFGTSQALAQNSMHYQMSIGQPHSHEIPQSMRAMSRERPSHVDLMSARPISKSFEL
ncbi:hypothetical protein BJX61DRAFT_442269 [Aspergillus egyptiacus]|nr:hypothetical protein BJX61DRAFT_442269 [Aspergillus egyptiacus]